MSTPGRAYALRRLAETKRKNRNSVARGGGATIGGKRVSAATYTRRTGVTKKKAKANAKRSPAKHGGKFGRYSTSQLKKMSGARKGKRRSTRRKAKR